METRLDEARANIIRNAIINDKFGVGSEPLLEDHNITRDEFDAYLEYGVRLAAMYDWQEQNISHPTPKGGGLQ